MDFGFEGDSEVNKKIREYEGLDWGFCAGLFRNDVEIEIQVYSGGI